MTLNYKQKYDRLLTKINEIVFDVFIEEVAKTWSNPDNITCLDSKEKYKKVCLLINEVDKLMISQVEFLDHAIKTKKRGGVV